MFSAICITLLVTAALLLTIVRPKISDSYDSYNLGWLSIPVLLVAMIWTFLSCTSIVQAKQVGVLTTFGKPSDRTLSSGLHFKAPWQKVTTIDSTIQTDEYRGKRCIYVRLGDGNNACVSATIRWAVSEKNANKVYADFRSDDPTQNLRDSVVSTQFKAAVNTTFAGYDPTSELTSTEGASFTPDYEGMATKVTDVLLKHTKGLVDIESVTISYLKLDDKTQAKINSFQSEVAKTRIAQQAQKTAAEQAKANEILSKSINNDPNVLVSRCLDMLAEGEFTAPAGFTCWPGERSAVVVPATR